MSRERARNFFRGFWASEIPMEHWLTHDSDGGAEILAQALPRQPARLRELYFTHANGQNQVYFLVTHSGAMRVLFKTYSAQSPARQTFAKGWRLHWRR